MTRMHRRAPRRLRSAVLLLVLGGLVLAVAAVMAAEKPRVESVWTAETPEIDGKLTDWSTPLVSLGSSAASLGARNDGQFLYLALASSEQAARLMLGAAGFTVWMDPTGRDKKTFGVAIPPTITMGGRGMGGRPPDQYGQPPDRQGRPPQGQQGDPAQQGQEGRDAQREGGRGGPPIGALKAIEVLGPGKDDRRRLELSYARTIGLDAAVKLAEGVLVYELRVPLPVSESQPYGVRSTPGATISVGIETGKIERPGGEEGGRGPGGMGGMPPGGGGGGMMGGGGRGGMGGGPPGGGREGMPEMKPIKQWTVVQLAKPPA